MTIKVTAFDLKLALLDYFRFERQWVCVDEFRQADVVADTGNDFIEVEVKITKGDLVNKESKKTNKHCFYRVGRPYNRLWPNKFYFCVPETLAKVAMEMCLKLNPKYGVIAFNTHVFEKHIQWNYSFPHQKCLRMARTAKKLHESYDNHQQAIAKRASAKLVALMKIQSQQIRRNQNGTI